MVFNLFVLVEESDSKEVEDDCDNRTYHCEEYIWNSLNYREATKHDTISYRPSILARTALFISISSQISLNATAGIAIDGY